MKKILKLLSIIISVLAVALFVISALLLEPGPFLLNSIAVAIYIIILNFNLAYGTSKSMLDSSRKRRTGGFFYWPFVVLSFLGRAFRHLVLTVSRIGLRSRKSGILLKNTIEIALTSLFVFFVTKLQTSGTIVISHLASSLFHPIALTTSGENIIGNTIDSTMDVIGSLTEHVTLVSDIATSCGRYNCGGLLTIWHVLATLVLLFLLYLFTYATIFGILYGTLLPLRTPYETEDKITVRYEQLKADLIGAASGPLETFSSIYVTFIVHRPTLLLVIPISLIASAFLVTTDGSIASEIFASISPVSDIIKVLINFLLSLLAALLVQVTVEHAVSKLPDDLRNRVYRLSGRLYEKSVETLGRRVSAEYARATEEYDWLPAAQLIHVFSRHEDTH